MVGCPGRGVFIAWLKGLGGDSNSWDEVYPTVGLRIRVDESRQDSFLTLGLIAEGWLYGWFAGKQLREEGLYIEYRYDRREESWFITIESFLMRGEEAFMVGLGAKRWY
jgi:hypothetical protein